MNFRASKITHSTIVNTDQEVTILSDPVTIFGIIVDNNSNNLVTFKDSSGTTLFIVRTSGSQKTIVIDLEFVADNGLTITNSTSGESNVSIFHSQPGA